MDQFEKDYVKETGLNIRIIPEYNKFNPNIFYTEPFVNYLKNRLKDAEEKIKQLIIYAKTL